MVTKRSSKFGFEKPVIIGIVVGSVVVISIFGYVIYNIYQNTKILEENVIVPIIPIRTPTPARSPMATPARSPMATPVRTPMVTPVRTPMVTPARTPMVTPARTPMVTPAPTKPSISWSKMTNTTGSVPIPYNSDWCNDSDDTNKKECFFKNEQDAQVRCEKLGQNCMGYGQNGTTGPFQLYKGSTQDDKGNYFWKKV